ncbi:hypothetical protein GU920_15595 [Rhodobacter sp. CCP-1]|uniref:ABM domain-containing protein n=1 Tax=Paragemmobacter ruber TaxID=1985673 RepID=A0ABW9Y8X0_9RHOB|nr:hypothetical protein [Rhodobacter ruber]
MMRPILTLAPAFAIAFALAPSLAPADGARGAPAPCVKVVTFRLVPGTEEAAFLYAARATEGSLRKQPGFLRRRLVQGGDRQWSDWVEWRDAASAHAAADPPVWIFPGAEALAAAQHLPDLRRAIRLGACLDAGHMVRGARGFPQLPRGPDRGGARHRAGGAPRDGA